MFVHALVPLLLLAAAAVLFLAGSAKLINVVDYKRIADPRAFNVYAARVSLIFAALAGVVTFLAWLASPYRDILSLLYVPVILGPGVTVMAGSERFKSPPSATHEA